MPIAIPRAIDLPSAIQAINQLITIYNPLIQNNFGFATSRNGRRSSRTTMVRVFNPNDQEQWVDVERITNLVFQDRTTDALVSMAVLNAGTGAVSLISAAAAIYQPHGEDFFNRIVNVHWRKKGVPLAGGVFIAAE